MVFFVNMILGISRKGLRVEGRNDIVIRVGIFLVFESIIEIIIYF